MSGFGEAWNVENYGETGKGGLSEARMWADGLEECETCGAMLFPSTSFPWHYPDDDCRALKDPCTGSEWDSYSERPHAEDARFHGSRSLTASTNGVDGGEA